LTCFSGPLLNKLLRYKVIEFPKETEGMSTAPSMELLASSSPETVGQIRKLLKLVEKPDTSALASLTPEDRQQLASITVVGDTVYTSSGDIAQGMTRAGLRIPYFLEDPRSPNFVAPQIAALVLHAQSLM